MFIRKIILGTLLVFLITSFGMAQYLARESFDYPQGDSLAATTGLAINGWSDSWTYNDGGANIMTIGGVELPYGDLGYPITNIGNHVTVSNPGGWVAERERRSLDKTWPDETGKVYWVSFVFESKKVPTGNTYYILKLFSGDSELLAMGKSGGGTLYSCGSGWASGSGDDVSSTQCEGGPVWLVTKIVMSGDATNERTFMWINPDPAGAEPDTNLADVKRWSGMNNGFNNVRLECGGADTNQTNWDELRLGTSWGDVSSDIFFARESFDYPIGTSIDTLMGTASNGWAGSWYKIVTNQANALVASDIGLPYEDLNYAVPNVGNHLESVPDTSGKEQRYGRHLDKTWSNEAGRTYWISVLMDIKNATANTTWLGVKLYDGDSGELEMFGKGHGLDKYTVGNGWHGGAGPEVTDISWDYGPVWLVGKVVMQGSTSTDPDTTYMWINPDPAGGEPDISVVNALALTNIKNGFNTVRIEFGGDVGDGLSVSFDELRLSTLWGEVSGPLITDVEWTENIVPTEFTLNQNYPNPFNPSTKISYVLKNTGTVRLTVYDMLGREVAELANEVQSAGIHEMQFNASSLSSGIYFYRLQSTSGLITKKMLLLK